MASHYNSDDEKTKNIQEKNKGSGFILLFFLTKFNYFYLFFRCE